MVRISIFVFHGQLFKWYLFFLILWPGINVDSHVVLTVFHFVTVNIVKRKVLFQGYTWCGEGRIENRSFPGSRISACDRFRIPNFLIFSICFSSFHLFIISVIYYNHSYLFTLKTSDRKLKLCAKSRLPWKQEEGEEKNITDKCFSVSISYCSHYFLSWDYL